MNIFRNIQNCINLKIWLHLSLLFVVTWIAGFWSFWFERTISNISSRSFFRARDSFSTTIIWTITPGGLFTTQQLNTDARSSKKKRKKNLGRWPFCSSIFTIAPDWWLAIGCVTISASSAIISSPVQDSTIYISFVLYSPFFFTFDLLNLPALFLWFVAHFNIPTREYTSNEKGEKVNDDRKRKGDTVICCTYSMDYCRY